MENPQTARPRLIERVLARTGNPLEWSTVDKCLALLAFLTGVGALYAAWGFSLLARPEEAPYLNLDSFRTAVWIQSGEVALWLALFSVGLAIRRRFPESRIFLHVVIQLYATFNALGTYAIGQFSSSAGIIWMANAFVALILFPWKTVAPALIPTCAVLGYTAWGGWKGTIPYAPLLKEAPFESGGKIALWWIVNFGISSVLIAGLSLGVFAVIIFLWRDREEKLAEAYVLLRAQKDRLVRAESLAAVGSLVAGAAHELRNPLSSSYATLQSLEEEIGGAAETGALAKQELLSSVRLALQGQGRASAIIERLYELTDDLSAASSTASAEDILGEVSLDFPAVRVESEGVPPSLRLNHRACKTILTNLLSNAIAAGGSQPVRLQVLGGGGHLTFAVSDSGKGIPAAILPEVFKPFFTGQKAGKGHGAGLGLYIVHELVTRMGGSVELESQEGKGTRVNVRVPLDGPTEQPKSAA